MATPSRTRASKASDAAAPAALPDNGMTRREVLAPVGLAHPDGTADDELVDANRDAASRGQ